LDARLIYVVEKNAPYFLVTMLELLNLIIFFFVGLLVAVGLVALVQKFGAKGQLRMKTKQLSYECGFEAFGDARTPFNIQFFQVALLFLIFDIELLFIFPWAYDFINYGFLGYFSMLAFLFILILGLWFEWVEGVLDWSEIE